MNTNIHMILETLSYSFKVAKGILKDYRVFIWKSKVLLPRRKTRTPNKESSRDGIREQDQGQVFSL